MGLFDSTPGLPYVADDIVQSLRDAGLDPSGYGMDAQLEKPALKKFHPQLLDYLAPMLHEIASYRDPRRMPRNTWLGPALAGLSAGYMGIRQRQAQDVTEENTAERQRVALQNQAALASARAGREQFGKDVRAQSPDGVLLTRRQLLEKKREEAAADAKATAKARVEGENEARVGAGGKPIGSTTPKPTPTPKPGKFNPNTWKLWGDVDEQQIKAYDDELKQMRQDFNTAPAFQPVRRDRNGNAQPEKPDVANARRRIAEIQSAKREVTRRAIEFHLASLPKGGEAFVFGQLHTAAQNAGLLSSDPAKPTELDKRFEEVAGKVLGGK